MKDKQQPPYVSPPNGGLEGRQPHMQDNTLENKIQKWI